MNSNLQSTVPDLLQTQESTRRSHHHYYTNTTTTAPNRTHPVPLDLAVVRPPNNHNTNNNGNITNPAAMNPVILMNAMIQQGLCRPGAPIHIDHRTRFDPGIQVHDILLPFHVERHSSWRGNQQLKQLIASSHPETSPKQLLAHILQQFPHVRVFTVPDVDAATVSNLETATLPYYLVPHQQANAELYKIVLDLATQSLSDKVEEQHEEKEEEGHVENKEKPNEEKHVKNEEKQKEPEDTSYNVTNGTPVTPPRNETAATARLVANRPALNKPVKKPRLIPKLKQSTVDIPRPKIQSPADISELYSNPMFSFAFPERPKQRKHKTNTAAAATTAAIKQEHQPAFCNDDEVKDVEKEKDDQVTTRKRPATVDSHSTTVPPPRREPKKTKHLTKRTKRKNPPPPPSTPDSIDDHLLPYLPKGVTRRPSGRWQAQVYFSGASRYIGVYSSSHQANSAYDAFKTFVKPYKEDALRGVLSRQKIHALVEEGRRHVNREFGTMDGDDDAASMELS